MISDKFSNPLYQSQDLFELVYKDYTDFKEVLVEPSTEIEQFEAFSELALKKINPELYSIAIEDFDQACQSDWFVPDEYKAFNIGEFCISQCSTNEELLRVTDELVEFDKRNMLPLLRVLKYLVDTFRKNDVLWGVGRGSSVASYVLYLLGVHRIDSIKYTLDWREFLR